MVNENDFDEFLRSRFVPEPRSNLEERIISAALQSCKVIPEKVTLSQKVKQFFSELVEGVLLPAPAFSFAAVLLIGIMIGGDFYFVPVVETEIVALNTQEEDDIDMYSYFELADLSDYGDTGGI